MSQIKISYFIFKFLAVVLLACVLGCSQQDPKVSLVFQEVDRQAILDFAKQKLASSSQSAAPQTNIPGDWTVTIEGFENGASIFKLRGESSDLFSAIAVAANQVKVQGIETSQTDRRLFISASRKTGQSIKLVEYQNQALEVVGDDVVALRLVNKKLIEQHIEESKDYLLRVMNQKFYGFPRLYNATTGILDKRLRTIYSASSLWTLMHLSDFDHNPEIAKRIPYIAKFLLSMQVKTGPMKGAFHHSFSVKDGSKENLFVVGTASKTIFTLLELFRRFHDQRYLSAAMNAGNWLLSKQNSDGTLRVFDQFKDGIHIEGKKYSTLYHGQVLSALSRLYRVSHDQKYLDGATKLAELIVSRAKKDNFFLLDQYRPSDDPVPTSWGVMSLLDYYKAQPAPEIKNTLWALIHELWTRQNRDETNLRDFGRFCAATDSSSNGWINEVFSEVYRFGQAEGWDSEELQKLKESILFLTRWILQNTYTPENTFHIKNPEQVRGGLIRNYTIEAVRTDAVCHGLNGFLYMYPFWSEGTLLSLPLN